MTGLTFEQFPILKQGLYFNHAAVGPWPRCTAEAVKNFADENMRQGSAAYREWLAREDELRRGLVELTGAGSTDDIALLKNTTEGICTVAFGLDWKPGENVVLPRGEFPSNRLPWLAQAARGNPAASQGPESFGNYGQSQDGTKNYWGH